MSLALQSTLSEGTDNEEYEISEDIFLELIGSLVYIRVKEYIDEEIKAESTTDFLRNVRHLSPGTAGRLSALLSSPALILPACKQLFPPDFTPRLRQGQPGPRSVLTARRLGIASPFTFVR